MLDKLRQHMRLIYVNTQLDNVNMQQKYDDMQHNNVNMQDLLLGGRIFANQQPHFNNK